MDFLCFIHICDIFAYIFVSLAKIFLKGLEKSVVVLSSKDRIVAQIFISFLAQIFSTYIKKSVFFFHRKFQEMGFFSQPGLNLPEMNT